MSEYDELVTRLREPYAWRGLSLEAADAIEALVGENARLNALIGPSLEAALSPLRKYISELQDVNKAAETEVERLKGALEWYADENNWRDQPFLRMDHLGRECEDLGPAEIWSDNGGRARSALEAKP